MASKYQKTTAKERYIGEILHVKRNSVSVMLRDSEGMEMPAEITREYFPKGFRLKVGMAFAYKCDVAVRMMSLHEQHERGLIRKFGEIELSQRPIEF